MRLEGIQTIQEFVKEYYSHVITKMWTVEEFEKWKEICGYQEWDYPLNEYVHIAQNEWDSDGETSYVPVLFATEKENVYECRFCEIMK